MTRANEDMPSQEDFDMEATTKPTPVTTQIGYGMLDALAPAFIRAQGELTDPVKDTQGYGYKYATLDQILQIVRPIFAKHGLAVMQHLTGGDNGHISVRTMILHETGQTMESTMSMPISNKKGMSAEQNIGAAVSYARRYALQSCLGLMAEEDTDAADAEPKKAKTNGKAKPVASISPEQESEIRERGDSCSVNWIKLCALLGTASIDTLPADDYANALALIAKKQEQVNKENDHV
jgi:hypothetical protein